MLSWRPNLGCVSEAGHLRRDPVKEPWVPHRSESLPFPCSPRITSVLSWLLLLWRSAFGRSAQSPDCEKKGQGGIKLVLWGTQGTGARAMQKRQD